MGFLRSKTIFPKTKGFLLLNRAVPLDDEVWDPETAEEVHQIVGGAQREDGGQSPEKRKRAPHKRVFFFVFNIFYICF